MALTSSIKLNIAEKLKNKDYRSRFFRGQAQDLIAMSIRNLRKKRKKKQADLADECEMKQSAISRIEQADYSGWSFNTLLRIADALDARLRVSFDLAEDVIDEYREREAIATTDTVKINTARNILEKEVEVEVEVENILLKISDSQTTIRDREEDTDHVSTFQVAASM